MKEVNDILTGLQVKLRRQNIAIDATEAHIRLIELALEHHEQLKESHPPKK